MISFYYNKVNIANEIKYVLFIHKKNWNQHARKKMVKFTQKRKRKSTLQYIEEIDKTFVFLDEID